MTRNKKMKFDGPTMNEHWDTPMLEDVMRRYESLTPTERKTLTKIIATLDDKGALCVDYLPPAWTKVAGLENYQGKMTSTTASSQNATDWVVRLCLGQIYDSVRLVPATEASLLEQLCSGHGNTPGPGAVDSLWILSDYNDIRDYTSKNEGDSKEFFLAALLQDIEAKTIAAAIEFLNRNGHQVGAYVADGAGVLIKKTKVLDLAALSLYCYNKTNYRVEFVHDTILPSEADKSHLRHQFNDYTKPNTSTFTKVLARIELKSDELQSAPIESTEIYTTEITDYIVDEMNTCFGVVVSGKCEIFEREPGELPRTAGARRVPKYVGRDIAAFTAAYKQHTVKIPKKGRSEDEIVFKDVAIVELWLENPKRLQYSDLIFNPNPLDSNDAPPPRCMNLFGGFAYEPTERYDDEKMKHLRNNELKTFIDHVYNILANGDVPAGLYFMMWLAATLVTPWRKLRTAIILRGDEGIGKGTLMGVVINCVGEQYVGRPQSIEDATGGFNWAHTSGKVVMFLDEATFGGDARTTGKLKKLITEEYVFGQQKYKEVRPLSNYMSVIMASNEEHVVAASANSRRYMVMDCSEKYAGPRHTAEEKKAYFDPIRATDPQILVNYLSSLEFRTWDENDMPSTLGTSVQRENSLKSTQEFVLDFLGDPAIIHYAKCHDAPPGFEGSYSRNALYTTYLKHCNPGKFDKRSQQKFIELVRIHTGATLPDAQTTHNNIRVRMIAFGGLNEARATFIAKTGMSHYKFTPEPK